MVEKLYFQGISLQFQHERDLLPNEVSGIKGSIERGKERREGFALIGKPRVLKS